MKAIMYHYVRQYDPAHPNFRYLDIQNFKKQLDYFADHFGFVSQDEWNDYITDGILPPRAGKIVLTFDDAMRCHYDHVFPELTKRGLWGIFYVPTQPYVTGKLLDVHRIHLLCGAFLGTDLFDYLNSLVSDQMMTDQKRAEFRENTYVAQTNDQGVSEFKRLLNYFIDYRFRAELIDKIAQHFGYTFDASSFYVAKENLIEMQENGMVIGSHTINHPVMSKLTKSQQSEQILASFEYLHILGIKGPKTYCHPYGGFHSFDQNTIDILEQNKVSYSFNVESREISKDDFYHSRQHLPRFDCNEFVFGKAS